MGRINLLADEVAEILEPNLQFLRTGPTDTKRYFAGPDALHALGWTITAICLPIFLGGVNEVVKAKINDWLNAQKESRKIADDLPSDVQAELSATLEATTPPGISEADRIRAVAEVSGYLKHRGWPGPLANVDAEEIVTLLEKQVGKPH